MGGGEGGMKMTLVKLIRRSKSYLIQRSQHGFMEVYETLFLEKRQVPLLEQGHLLGLTRKLVYRHTLLLAKVKCYKPLSSVFMRPSPPAALWYRGVTVYRISSERYPNNWKNLEIPQAFAWVIMTGFGSPAKEHQYIV